MSAPIYILAAINPQRSSVCFCADAETFSEIEPYLILHGEDSNAVLTVLRFTDKTAEEVRAKIAHLDEAASEEGSQEDEDEARDQLEVFLEEFLFPHQVDQGEYPEHDDPMDGDHESALASAGMGTDEDYGHFGGDDGFGED